MIDLSLKNWTGPGADEFMRQSESSDVYEEQKAHDEKRNTGRHPDQPTYPAPFADREVAEALNG